jgi:hypothetical protein
VAGNLKKGINTDDGELITLRFQFMKVSNMCTSGVNTVNLASLISTLSEACGTCLFRKANLC